MRKKKPFHDPAPDIHDFPGVPESTFDLVNQYGTYNIQPTSHTENLFPLIGPELPERWRTMRLGKDDLDGLVESVLETGKEQVTKYEFKQVVQEESEDGI